jgi:guanosine-3',5'-bis(diphosphate) 3'-pyrophosphohydrolase
VTDHGSSALLRALVFAAEKHRNQRRKDRDASPYINHPIAVAAVLALEAGVTDEATLLAALLHDTIEDTETTAEELEQAFGAEVAGLVRELSDDKSLPKQTRKQLQVERAATASPKAKRLKIADKICNIRDVMGNLPANWSLDRRREYLTWAERVVEGCRGTDATLEALFDQVLREARGRLGVDG